MLVDAYYRVLNHERARVYMGFRIDLIVAGLMNKKLALAAHHVFHHCLMAVSLGVQIACFSVRPMHPILLVAYLMYYIPPYVHMSGT